MSQLPKARGGVSPMTGSCSIVIRFIGLSGRTWAPLTAAPSPVSLHVQSGEGEEPPPQGLVVMLTQTGPRCPTGQVMRHHLYRQPGGV